MLELLSRVLAPRGLGRKFDDRGGAGSALTAADDLAVFEFDLPIVPFDMPEATHLPAATVWCEWKSAQYGRAGFLLAAHAAIGGDALAGALIRPVTWRPFRCPGSFSMRLDGTHAERVAFVEAQGLPADAAVSVVSCLSLMNDPLAPRRVIEPDPSLARRLGGDRKPRRPWFAIAPAQAAPAPAGGI